MSQTFIKTILSTCIENGEEFDLRVVTGDCNIEFKQSPQPLMYVNGEELPVMGKVYVMGEKGNTISTFTPKKPLMSADQIDELQDKVTKWAGEVAGVAADLNKNTGDLKNIAQDLIDRQQYAELKPAKRSRFVLLEESSFGYEVDRHVIANGVHHLIKLEGARWLLVGKTMSYSMSALDLRTPDGDYKVDLAYVEVPPGTQFRYAFTLESDEHLVIDRKDTAFYPITDLNLDPHFAYDEKAGSVRFGQMPVETTSLVTELVKNEITVLDLPFEIESYSYFCRHSHCVVFVTTHEDKRLFAYQCVADIGGSKLLRFHFLQDHEIGVMDVVPGKVIGYENYMHRPTDPIDLHADSICVLSLENDWGGYWYVCDKTGREVISVVDYNRRPSSRLFSLLERTV